MSTSRIGIVMYLYVMMTAFGFVFARSAQAQVLINCKATGTDLTSAQCQKETERALTACKESKSTCDMPKPAAVKPLSLICKENLGNAGKMVKVAQVNGTTSCRCDDPNYRLAVDGANWAARFCALVVDKQLVDQLAKLREALGNNTISRTEYEDSKRAIAGLATRNFVSQDDFNSALKDLGLVKADVKRLETAVIVLDNKVEAINDRVKVLEGKQEGRQDAARSRFSVTPEIGPVVVLRPLSGVFYAPQASLRLRWNAGPTSPWHLTTSGSVAYGDSKENSGSYAYRGMLGAGYTVGKARKISIDLAAYAQVYVADMVSNPVPGITTNGRGHAVGGLAGVDYHLGSTPLLLRGEFGLGGGIDNAVSILPNGTYLSRRDFALQPFGALSVGYRFDKF